MPERSAIDSVPKLEPHYSKSPFLPSRAILLIGALGLACLLLLAALALQLAEAPDTEPATGSAVALPAASPGAPSLPDEIPASLLDAYDEPLLAELATLLEAVHGTEAPLDPALHAYLADLVQRMNVEQEPYRARFLAPAAAIAQRRAERVQALFRNAGLPPNLLILSGHTGPDGVAVERS